MTDLHELSIPHSALLHSKAKEILRVWSAGDKQHVSIAVDMWDDAAVWGIFLVDLARHIANAYTQRKIYDSEEEVLTRLKQSFDAEWSFPTDTPTGS